MKDELSHKYSLYKRYHNKIEETTLVKRLGLKDWEYDYIRKKYESKAAIPRTA